MSLTPGAIEPIPQQTIDVASAAFPNGNVYIRMRDELGVFYEDEQFCDLFPSKGQPGLSPWRLALVTIMQYAENLTDRQAADAVRSRIDWKYALGLELTDCGFNFSVLSEFRSRLIAGQAEQRLLQTILDQFNQRGLLKSSRQRTDSTHVFAVLQTLNRLELVGEVLVNALNQLAVVAPDWLKSQVPADWFDKYGKRLQEYRLPKDKNERQTLATTIGKDGHQLLNAIYAQEAPDFLRRLPAVETMRQIFIQHYYRQGDTVYWRDKDNLPPSSVMICSPHETDARYSTKRERSWIGYKVHLTETCEKDSPNFITHVATTYATDPDISVTEKIHDDLCQSQLMPDQHLVDTAYVDAQLRIDSKSNYGCDLIAPAWLDNSWQAKTDGAFDHTQFAIDWENKKVTCPMGQTSRYFNDTASITGKPKIVIQFDKNDCLACQARSRCTKAKVGPRQLTLCPKPEYLANQVARQYQQTDEFLQRYKTRAGIEGTISQAANARGLRQCRYRGLAKTHLQHIATAAAMNLTRAIDWLCGKPQAKTRTSHFAALAA